MIGNVIQTQKNYYTRK